MRLLLLALCVAASVPAQQPNTVTASVQLTQAVTTGAAAFRIQFIEATTNSSVDTAAAALSSVGVSASQLTGVDVELNQGFVITTYNFLLSVPSGEYAATRDKLITVQRSLANSQTQALGWTASLTPTDEELAAALDTAMPTLLDRARQRATLLAKAMNATLGNLVTLSAPAVSPDGPTVTVSLTATYAVTPQ
jgi:hypothetical protein